MDICPAYVPIYEPRIFQALPLLLNQLLDPDCIRFKRHSKTFYCTVAALFGRLLLAILWTIISILFVKDQQRHTHNIVGVTTLLYQRYITLLFT